MKPQISNIFFIIGILMGVISPIPAQSLFSQIKEKATKAWQDFANPAPQKFVFAQPAQAQAQPTPTQAPQGNYEQAIRKGFEHWGSPPAATLSATYAQAPSHAPIFQKYPFLLPAQSILETSGGAKQKFQNNPQNWGIVPQGRGDYSPQSPEQVIKDAMSGIGGTRTLEGGFTPTQIRSQSYYDKFRQTQDLNDFAANYAPPTENDTAKYVQDLLQVMAVFDAANR